MQYLEQRNRALPDRFKRIAVYYKMHGEKLRVRWDYAFYQMLIETNFLTYRAGNGKWGDVKPNQNNFAGIGATGGGVPGDRYPNVSTGVLAQMQHLVAYSGEIVDNPVAPRTREVQQKVVELSRAVGRPITYRDLAGRWAADKKYGNTIASVAERFQATYCRGEPEPQIAANERAPAAQPVRTARAETSPAPRTTRSLPRGRGVPAEETLVVNDDGDDAPPQRGAAPAARAPQLARRANPGPQPRARRRSPPRAGAGTRRTPAHVQGVDGQLRRQPQCPHPDGRRRGIAPDRAPGPRRPGRRTRCDLHRVARAGWPPHRHRLPQPRSRARAGLRHLSTSREAAAISFAAYARSPQSLRAGGASSTPQLLRRAAVPSRRSHFPCAVCHRYLPLPPFACRAAVRPTTAQGETR